MPVPIVSRTRNAGVSVTPTLEVGVVLTNMQMKSRIQSHNATMLYNVFCGLESPLVLITPTNGRVDICRSLIGHEDRNLCREFRQFEWTCMSERQRSSISQYVNLQAKVVMTAPVTPPAAPKQAIVDNVGTLPGRLTTTNGSSVPVARPIAAENLYLTFW